MSYAEDIFNEQKELIDKLNIEKVTIKKHLPHENTIGEMLKSDNFDEQIYAQKILNNLFNSGFSLKQF